MEQLSVMELSKLSSACLSRFTTAQEIIDSDTAHPVEKALAKLEQEWMCDLSAKIERIIDSGTKRISIKRY